MALENPGKLGGIFLLPCGNPDREKADIPRRQHMTDSL